MDPGSQDDGALGVRRILGRLDDVGLGPLSDHQVGHQDGQRQEHQGQTHAKSGQKIACHLRLCLFMRAPILASLGRRP